MTNIKPFYALRHVPEFSDDYDEIYGVVHCFPTKNARDVWVAYGASRPGFERAERVFLTNQQANEHIIMGAPVFDYWDWRTPVSAIMQEETVYAPSKHAEGNEGGVFAFSYSLGKHDDLGLTGSFHCFPNDELRDLWVSCGPHKSTDHGWRENIPYAVASEYFDDDFIDIINYW